MAIRRDPTCASSANQVSPRSLRFSENAVSYRRWDADQTLRLKLDSQIRWSALAAPLRSLEGGLALELQHGRTGAHKETREPSGVDGVLRRERPADDGTGDSPVANETATARRRSDSGFG